MKKNKQILNILSIVVFSAILFVACSKARIEGPVDAGTVDETDNQTGANKLHFVPLTDYYKTKQKKPEYLSINVGYPWNSTSTGLIFAGAMKAIYENGAEVSNPITGKIIELYNIKNFIYYNITTIVNNKIFNTLAIFKIQIYKDSTELLLVDYGNTKRNINIRNINNYGIIYKVYYLNNIENWLYTNYDIEQMTNNTALCNLHNLGWFMFANPYNFNTTEYKNLTFTSSNADLTNVGIYICFSDINSYTKVEDCTSIPLPVGELAKIMAIGITNKNELYYDYKEIVIDKNKTNYDINMKPTTDELLTQVLDSL